MTIEVKAWRGTHDNDRTPMRTKALAAELTRLDRKLRDLGVTGGGRVPFKVLVAALAEQRARPVRLKAVDLPPGHTGHVLVTPAADVMLYSRSGWPSQQLNALSHEFGHLLAGHTGAPLAHGDIAQILAPDIAPEVILRLLGRGGFTDFEEKVAESMAAKLALNYLTDDLPDGGEWVGPEDLRTRLLYSLGLSREG